MKVGVLALQGDFAAHIRAIPGAVEVRHASDVDHLEALVIPGGESTTLLKLAGFAGIDHAVARMVERGGIVFGTCAGAILLARRVFNPEQPSWDLLDIDVERNAWGSQVDSFEATLEPPYSGVFIRAPRIRRTGPQVKVLARYENEPVLVRQERVFASTFHPELTTDRRIYEMVFASAHERSAARAEDGAAPHELR